MNRITGAEWTTGVSPRVTVSRTDLEDNVGEAIREIGRETEIEVAPGKCPSAQDFRRAFATRWASKVMPADLQRLMRHKNIKTTMKYYVDLDLGEINDRLEEAMK